MAKKNAQGTKTLVHYAYALGIRRGRESTRPPIEPTDKG